MPCRLVRRPLAASLALTDCGGDLMAFFGAGSLCVLMISMRKGRRPPGAIFFLHRRRKNMERKTPRESRGVPRPTDPPPWVGVGGVGGYVSTTRQTCQCIRALIAGEQTACRFAVAYALRWGLDGFFRGWWLLRLNIFHAIGLAPSGGHILSSPAKKEYGKKDAAQGGGFPALRTHPLGWGSGVRVVMFRLPGRFASASVP